MQLISELCEERILERVPKGLRILDWEQVRALADEMREADHGAGH